MAAATVMKQGGVISFAAAGDTFTGKKRINAFRWTGITTAGHALEVRVGAYGTDEILFTANSDTTNHMEEFTFEPPLLVENIKVQTMGSGTLYLYTS